MKKQRFVDVLSVRMTQRRRADWSIDIRLENGLQEGVIHASACMPPFNYLVEFWWKIAHDYLPCLTRVDEEGPEKILVAGKADRPELVWFMLEDYDRVLIHGVFNRRQLVRAFYEEFARFRVEEFDPQSWGVIVTYDDLLLDLGKYLFSPRAGLSPGGNAAEYPASAAGDPAR